MLSIERTAENLLTGGKTVNQTIDPNTKAELIELCVNGILELLAAKGKHEEGRDDPYQVMDAIHDLLENDSELCQRLAKVFDPDVCYDFAVALVGEDMPADPTLLPDDPELQKAIATDVAFIYAWTSPEIRAYEQERAA